MANRSRAAIRAGWAIVAALGLVAGPPPTVSAAGPLPPQLPTSDRFQPGPCPFELAGEEAQRQTQCGVLSVPERRDRPNGRTLALAVAVARARDPARALEPVIYLAGGPGASALHELSIWGGSTLGDRHDVILLDQRGTGFSKPSLVCGLGFGEMVPPDERWTREELFQNYEVGTAKCRSRLIADDVDIAAYTTNENAADVEDLRVALGIEQWSLYGISYGTRLALEVMRDHPDGVKAVVLDSAYPPQAPADEDQGARLDRAFDALVALCASDAACAASYPDLGARFADSMDRLGAKPFLGYGEIASHTIEAALRGWLYQTQVIGLLPALVHSAEIGNTAPYLPILEALPPSPDEVALGLNLSIECSERQAQARPSAIAADVAAHPRWRALLERDWVPTACQAWNVPAASPADLAPVHSSIPTLIFEGTLDPATPPSYGDMTAATLDHATVVRVPGFGHGVTVFHCPSGIRDAFLVDPSASLDTSCVDTVFPSSGRFITDRVANVGLGRIYTQLLFGLNGPTLGDRLIAGYVFGVFALTLVGWAALALRSIRRRRAAPVSADPVGGAVTRRDETPTLVRLARALGLAAIAADLVFVVGLAVTLAGETDPLQRALGLPVGVAWILGAAAVGAICAIGLAVVVGVIVARRIGRRRTRIHLIVLASACLIAGGVLRYYGVF